jgi:hypothetical protein
MNGLRVREERVVVDEDNGEEKGSNVSRSGERSS